MNKLPAFLWWHSNRPIYKRKVSISFALAYILFISIGFLFQEKLPQFEFTFFTLFFQLIGIFLALTIAQLLYYFGFFAEKILSPKDPLVFRNKLFKIGLYFSCALPFCIPLLLLSTILNH